MKYELLTEKILNYFTSEKFTSEVNRAKKLFFENAGIFDEEAPEFEMKMTQFADWYLFVRPLNDHPELTPVEYVLTDQNEFKVEPEVRTFYENLKNSTHSLFEYLKEKNADIYLKDLVDGKKLLIKKADLNLGIHKGEIFETRLIPHEDTFIFGPSFCFHPPQASKYIMKEIKRIKKIKEDTEKKKDLESFMHRLFKMRYKHEQYKHVGIAEIYTNEPKLRI